MTLFAIADLHLSFGSDKPMDIFGPQWKDHAERLRAAWSETVAPEDVVLVPGDISWAMHLPELAPDLDFLETLPGRKILLRGNHDYWWTTLAKMDRFLEQHGYSTISFLRNTGLRIGGTDPDGPGTVICGTRGWLLPEDAAFGVEDEKILAREVGRLNLSLAAGERIRCIGDRLVVALHYPPMSAHQCPTPFSEVLEAHGADVCVYGHLHGEAAGRGVSGVVNGVLYRNASADYISFKPLSL
jgi:predicted phosphohydrolase